MPVIDARRRVVGIVAASDLIRGQQMALRAALRRVASPPEGTALLEERVGDGSAYKGRTVAEAGWPAGTVIASIQRGNQLLFPEPDTVLEPGGVVSALTHIQSAETLRQDLRGMTPRTREPEEPGADLI